MKKMGIRVFLSLILIAVFVIGTVSSVSAARPIRLLSITPAGDTAQIPGTYAPISGAGLSFNNIGAHGYKYQWFQKVPGGGYLPIHDEEVVWFDKHKRSGLVSLLSPTSTTVNDGDILKVQVSLVKKNGGSVKGGTTAASYPVVSPP